MKMWRFVLAALMLCILTGSLAAETEETRDLSAQFGAHAGAFALYDAARDRWIRYQFVISPSNARSAPVRARPSRSSIRSSSSKPASPMDRIFLFHGMALIMPSRRGTKIQTTAERFLRFRLVLRKARSASGNGAPAEIRFRRRLRECRYFERSAAFLDRGISHYFTR